MPSPTAPSRVPGPARSPPSAPPGAGAHQRPDHGQPAAHRARTPLRQASSSRSSPRTPAAGSCTVRKNSPSNPGATPPHHPALCPGQRYAAQLTSSISPNEWSSIPRPHIDIRVAPGQGRRVGIAGPFSVCSFLTDELSLQPNSAPRSSTVRLAVRLARPPPRLARLPSTSAQRESEDRCQRLHRRNARRAFPANSGQGARGDRGPR